MEKEEEMFIVTKDGKSIINARYVTSIYMGVDKCCIKADFENGKGCQIARYDTDKYSEIAMNVIADSIRRDETICYMPDDKGVKARLNIEEQKYHHLTGKKTKGRGGS